VNHYSNWLQDTRPGFICSGSRNTSSRPRTQTGPWNPPSFALNGCERFYSRLKL